MTTIERAAPGSGSEKEALIKRLHRIAGQVRGIERMVQKEADCVDILNQISAVNTALEALALRLLDNHAKHCLADALAAGDRAAAEQKRRELLEAVQRFAHSR